MSTTFPEVDRFVADLREHYRRCGVPNGDAIADGHGEWVYGMYHASTTQSEFYRVTFVPGAGRDGRPAPGKHGRPLESLKLSHIPA
jgi:hypothetical protein